jgi:hypothetical protein
MFRRVIAIIVSVILVTAIARADTPDNANRIRFAQEFLREIEALYYIQQQLERDLVVDASAYRKLLTSIRISTRIVSELQLSITMLQPIALDQECSAFPQALQKLYGQKVDLHNELIKLYSILVSKEKPGVDYGSLGARVSQIMAELENIDLRLLSVAPAVALCLVDEKQDSQGHLRLIITKSERKKMTDRIDLSFGPRLREKKDQSVTVGSAIVMRAALLKYKASDEP